MPPPGGSKSKSEQHETKLSSTQATILKNREAMYQKYFFPAMLGELQQTEGQGMTAQLAQTGLANLNQAYQGAKTDVSRSLAQRELTGGFQGSAMAGLEVARAQGAADTVNKAYLQNKQLRGGLIGQALQASPTPTQSAQYATRTRSG